jgi:hypothetical protein
MKPVRITKLAQTEIDDAASWFERRKQGLGIEFYRRVDEAAEKIELNPKGFQEIYKDMRHVNLEQFKEWGLFFRIGDDGSIVIACISGKRHPSLKHERASGVIAMPKPR